jgi:hypothetical protein
MYLPAAMNPFLNSVPTHSHTQRNPAINFAHHSVRMMAKLALATSRLALFAAPLSFRPAMHDYSLEHLNTRSFEQLVQALSLAVLGSSVSIFGDGPDGGREATFNGRINYPEGGPWNGYGIVQAKFRQRPDAEPKANADWVIENLKAEFAKFSPAEKLGGIGVRHRPAFYVIATNVALSAVAGTGGKDRVAKTLDGFKKTHGLKGYAIWDRDQICRLLDSHTGIRTTYAAWLTPGDVLMQMIKHLELGGSDFGEIMLRYLRVELLDDQLAKLSQGGYTEANNIPLSNVFVDLPLESQEKPKDSKTDEAPKRVTFLASILEEGRKVLRPSYGSRPDKRTLLTPPVEGRIVLIGGPGQGKTTVGVFTCQLLRAALLRDAAANYAPEVERALQTIENECHTMPPVHALRYPLRVDLKRLAESLAGKGDIPSDSLLDFLIKHISKRAGTDLRRDEFRQWIATYPWLLVLDGLDEVPASSNRKQVTDAIRDFVSIEAHDRDADLLILATTRPQGYSNEFDATLYRHLTLAPLQPVEALHYGTRLAEARHPGLRTRIEDLTSALRRATSNPATARLMESPLQVTIMLSLIEGGGEPPEQRWKLFRDYYDVIYRREKERGTSYSEILRRYEPDMHWLHHRVGWLLQRRNASAGQTASRLTHGELEELVNQRLLKRGHNEDEPRAALVKEIRLAATERLVLLVGNTENEIGFEIRSLQEFMAAEHCFDGGEDCARKTLHTIAAYPYWLNVFLFIAGRIFFEKESLIDSVISVCEQLNEPLTDPALGASHAGSRLALALLHDGVTRNQPENTRVLARCAARALEGDDLSVVPIMSSLTNTDIVDVWRDELVAIARDHHASLPMFAWRLCVQMLAAGQSWAADLLRTKFPWHHEDVWAFMLGTLDQKEALSPEFWRLFEPYMYRHSPVLVLHLLRQADQGIPQQLGIPQLENLHSLARTQTSPSEVELLSDTGEKTGMRFLIQSLKHDSAWQPLKNKIPVTNNIHPDWLIFRAVSEFAEAPSPTKLAEVVDRLGRIPSDKLWRVNWVLPWQARYCSGLLERGLSSSSVQTEVQDGSLGTADDWAHWETLISSGISLHQLGEHGLPRRISPQSLRPLLSPFAWSLSIGFDDKDMAFSDSLAALVESAFICDPEILQTVVCMCAHRYGRWSQRGQPIPDGIIRLINACLSRDWLISREFVFRLIDAASKSIVAKDLLVAIRLRVDGQWCKEDETTLNSLDNAVCRLLESVELHSDTGVRIVGAMSFLPPVPAARKIPEVVLALLEHQDEAHRRASVVLRINGLSWKPEDSARLAGAALDCRKAYPGHLPQWLDFVDSSGSGGSAVETFLVVLLKLLREADDSRYLTTKAAALLNTLVKRRPTIEHLIDPTQACSV